MFLGAESKGPDELEFKEEHTRKLINGDADDKVSTGKCREIKKLNRSSKWLSHRVPRTRAAANCGQMEGSGNTLASIQHMKLLILAHDTP